LFVFALAGLYPFFIPENVDGGFFFFFDLVYS